MRSPENPTPRGARANGSTPPHQRFQQFVGYLGSTFRLGQHLHRLRMEIAGAVIGLVALVGSALRVRSSCLFDTSRASGRRVEEASQVSPLLEPSRVSRRGEEARLFLLPRGSRFTRLGNAYGNHWRAFCADVCLVDTSELLMLHCCRPCEPRTEQARTPAQDRTGCAGNRGWKHLGAVA